MPSRTSVSKNRLRSTNGPERKSASSEAKVGRKDAVQKMAQSEAPPFVDDVLRERGKPLDRDTRSFFEPRFGADFSKVRATLTLRLPNPQTPWVRGRYGWKRRGFQSRRIRARNRGGIPPDRSASGRRCKRTGYQRHGLDHSKPESAARAEVPARHSNRRARFGEAPNTQLGRTTATC